MPTVAWIVVAGPAFAAGNFIYIAAADLLPEIAADRGTRSAKGDRRS
jgi:zinc transporter ZupT